MGKKMEAAVGGKRSQSERMKRKPQKCPNTTAAYAGAAFKDTPVKSCFSVCWRFPHLEQVHVSIRVAQTEDMLLPWVLRDGLDDAVISQESVARRKLLVGAAGAPPICLVKQQSAT